MSSPSLDFTRPELFFTRKHVEGEHTMTAEQVARHHGVPRKVFMQHIQKEVEEMEACCGLPFTLLLVVSYACVALTHDKATSLRAVEESMDDDLLDNANFAFTGPYMGHKGMYDVNSIADFWSFMSKGVLPLIFAQEVNFHEGYDESDPWYANHSVVPTADRGIWLQFNRIVGGIRIRQERSDNEECSNPEDLAKVYALQCVKGFGYELDPEIRSARFTAEPSGETWLYTISSLAELEEIIWNMERFKWLDKNTKKVEIAIPAYNGELGLHVMMYVNFFFNRGGHIYKKLMPLSFTSNLHPYWYYWAADLTWALCVIYILFSEMKEIYTIMSHSGMGGLKTEYLSIYNVVDWISMFCAFAVMGMFAGCMTQLGELNKSLASLPLPSNSTEYRDGVGSHIKKLESTVEYVYNFRMVMAAYPLIIILRLFKAYSAQPRLAIVTHTLGSAAQELGEFALIFCSVFLTFTISGVILFGREVGSFGTMPRAFFASFRLLLGELMWEDNVRVGRLLALVFTALFMLVIVCLLLNMLLAIIMKHYVEAKDKAGNAQTLWSEAFQVFRRWRMEQKGLCVPIPAILHALIREDQRLAKIDELAEMEGLDDEEEELIEELGKPVRIEDLQDAYAAFTGDMEQLPEDQALELLEESVLEYYDQNNVNVDMDEVLKLTHKVEHRTRKIKHLLSQLEQDNQYPNEVEGLRQLLKDFEDATYELQRQKKAHRKQTEELRAMKRGILLQLQSSQAAMADAGNVDDPTSVNSLLSHGTHTVYQWKLSKLDIAEETNDMWGAGVDIDGLEGDMDGRPLGAGPAGPVTAHSQQPRWSFNDEDDPASG